jgi:hypothetical protein
MMMVCGGTPKRHFAVMVTYRRCKFHTNTSGPTGTDKKSTPPAHQHISTPAHQHISTSGHQHIIVASLANIYTLSGKQHLFLMIFFFLFYLPNVI